MFDQLLQDVKTIARQAGELILELRARQRQVAYKSSRDMVTEVDQASEDLIVSFIQNNYSEHDILAEEGGNRGDNSSEFQWIIDPLDGTTNFVHGFPAFCVSIAVLQNGEPVVGAIYDPLRDELFSALREKGAFLNDEPIHVSETDELGKSLLATGFPYANDGTFDLNMQLWVQIYGLTQGLRRAGAAALDLAWTACGRLDGFWELSLKPWDMAAGVLIVREAGGSISSPTQDAFDLFEGNIIATNSNLHQALSEKIRTIIRMR